MLSARLDFFALAEIFKRTCNPENASHRHEKGIAKEAHHNIPGMPVSGFALSNARVNEASWV